jgi:hypothetical protein
MQKGEHGDALWQLANDSNRTFVRYRYNPFVHSRGDSHDGSSLTQKDRQI